MESPIKIAGIDLAGSPRRPTGICLIEGPVIKTAVLYSDGELIENIEQAKPLVVAVDAPLSLPPGRCDIEDREGSHFRSCDLALRERRIRFFPVTLGPMRMLTQRGISLKRELEKLGSRVVEVYPGGAQDIWGLPRARKSREGLEKGLRKLVRKEFNLRFSRSSKFPEALTADELDAITAALVGLMYFNGQAELYGSGEQIIVMPGAQLPFRA